MCHITWMLENMKFISHVQQDCFTHLLYFDRSFALLCFPLPLLTCQISKSSNSRHFLLQRYTDLPVGPKPTYLPVHQTVDKEDKELIVTGNLNCGISLRFLQPNSNRLTEILNLFQLEQVITDPTRVTSTHESLLDIIATNIPDKLLNSSVLHISEYVPWMTKIIIQEMNHRDYLKKRAVASKSESLNNAY